MSDQPLHYRLECAMCSGTLEVESDSIKELFDIAIIHAKQYLHIHEKEYAERMGKLGTKKRNERLSKEADLSEDITNPPSNYKEVYHSPLFRWAILRMIPFDKGRMRADSEIGPLVK